MADHATDHVDLDDVATRRLLAAYRCDERPSLSSLSKRFGRSVNTLKAILEKNGVQVNARGRPAGRALSP